MIKRRTRQQIKYQLLNFLKINGRTPTSKLAVMLNYNYDHCKRLLEELEEAKQIIREEETNSIYWELKKEH